MKSSAPKKTTVKAASKAIPKTKVATVKKVAPKKTAVNAVKKVPVLKQAALKPLSPITIKPKTAPIKSAMPEFIVPLAVKKTISNEVEKVLTPTNKIAVAPLEAKKGELDDNCCGGHCDHNANKHSFSRAIIGLLLIIFGLIYLGKNLGILPFDINLNVYNFWPLIIIVIGFLLVNKKAKLSILAGVIGAATFALIIYFIMLYADSSYKADSEALAPSTIVPHVQKNEAAIATDTSANNNPEATSTINITNIAANDKISNPVHIEGEADGSWFFEASFPIKIVDENLNEIGQGQAKATSDWATSSPVKFTADITYTKASSSKAEIIFAKDNPSGLDQNYEKFTIPVELK